MLLLQFEVALLDLAKNAIYFGQSLSLSPDVPPIHIVAPVFLSLLHLLDSWYTLDVTINAANTVYVPCYTSTTYKIPRYLHVYVRISID